METEELETYVDKISKIKDQIRVATESPRSIGFFGPVGSKAHKKVLATLNARLTALQGVKTD